MSLYDKLIYLLLKVPEGFQDKFTLIMISFFCVFTAPPSRIQKRKVAEERGLILCSSLIQILIWKIQLSCLETNTVWHRGIFLCKQWSLDIYSIYRYLRVELNKL